MHDEVNDIKDFDIVALQYQKLLNLFLHFSMNGKAINILQLRHFCLPFPERTKYFHKMLDYMNHNVGFFSKLMTLCRANNQNGTEEMFLSNEDYQIID